jgi:hypothetical protein
MPEKDPLNYSWITYAWVLGVSIWAGVVSYIRKMQRSGRSVPFVQWVFGLAAECTIAGFVGLITFWTCEATGVPAPYSAVCIAVTAHMGSRALLMGERVVCRELFRRFRLFFVGSDRGRNGRL